MRARISRWAVGAALSIAVTLGGALAAVLPAHAQSINGLGQADQQFKRCQFATLDDAMCSAGTVDGGGQGWQLSLPSVEPAVGLVPAPCRRAREGE